jgi:pimeloyl-ACP methyl ester carboxylesterase
MEPSLPFRRGPFRELPALPRVPHAYARTQARDLSVTTEALGSTSAHVRVHGSGPPLLLVHGLMTSSYSWRYVFEPLGKHFTVYAPDLPGSGHSVASNGPPYSPLVLADWLSALQRALGIRGCAVIGNSMGGYIAMRLALRDPESMSRLINVHSPGVPEWRLHALGALLALPRAQELLAWYVQRDPLRWAHKNVHYYDESLKSLEEAREYGRPLGTPEGARAFVKTLAETMAIRDVREFHAELAARHAHRQAFPVPLMLMYAARDPMVPPRFGDEFRRLLPDAQFVRLQQASHFAHVDAVERFLPPALSFLSLNSRS